MRFRRLARWSVVVACLLAMPAAWAGAPRDRYEEALRLIKARQREQAFMLLRALVADQPNHHVTQQARFVLGEYHADTRNRADALGMLTAYLKRPTDPWWEVIATAYLVQMTPRRPGDTDPLPQETALKERLASKQLFLAFRESRTHTVQTPLGHTYRFREFVDHLEIERDGVAWYSISLQ